MSNAGKLNIRKWYEKPGEYNDVVICTRVRLARNLERFPFERKITPVQSQELATLVHGALENINLGDNKLNLYTGEELDKVTALSLAERHVASLDLVKKGKSAGMIVSEDESVSVMTGEEDHIRIQVMAAGLALNSALETANKFDDVLDQALDYAFDDDLGYLTSCPTNLGTGLRASVMLHLPAIERAGLLPQLTNAISKLGLTIRGSYGEGSKARGARYQISNQITLGISEQVAVQNLGEIVKQVIAQEQELRKTMLKQYPQLEDEIHRSYGILKYARSLSSAELFELLSNVRIGVSQGMLEQAGLNDITKLEFEAGSACITKQAQKELSAKERDAFRAEMVRSII